MPYRTYPSSKPNRPKKSGGTVRLPYYLALYLTNKRTKMSSYYASESKNWGAIMSGRTFGVLT